MDGELAETAEQVQFDEFSERNDPNRREAGLGPIGRHHWETYVRCLFLLTVIFATGMVSWRPGVLRLSVLLSLASPTRGESLAWKPEKDIPAPPEPPIRRRPPPEWRLGPGYPGGTVARTSGIRNATIRPGRTPRTAWARESGNPWNWQDDVKRLRKLDASDAAMPPQKPESQFRVGGILSWPESTGTGDGAQPRGAFPPSAPPLPESEAAETASPDAPDAPDRRPPSDAAFPFSGFDRMELPPLPPLHALGEPAAATVERSGPGSDREMPTLPPFAPAPASAKEHAEPDSGGAALRPPSPSVPVRPTPEPAPASTTPGETVDWKSREITGPIPGAYLTIYPKLKFIGLCVPGQGYVRKYNQVATPGDSTGAKMAADDGKTPYGKYYVAGREQGVGGPSLVLSWPSPEDAGRIGLDRTAIAAIEEAWREQRLPPQTTAAGGGLKLTSEGGEKETTAGGFALPEPEMEEIFTALPDGAWVFVQP